MTSPTAPRWAARVAGHRAAPALLVAMAVLEACAFPAPTEALFVALALLPPGERRASRARVWRFAALATLGSLAGAAVGYLLGAAYFAQVAGPLLGRLGLLGHLDVVGALYRRNAFLALATSGYTPIPYVLYTLAAGAYNVPLAPFLLGSLVGRGVKYAILAAATTAARAVLVAAARRWGGSRRARAVAAVVLAGAALAFALYRLSRGTAP